MTAEGTVEGAELLDELRHVLSRYVILPSKEAVTAVVLWIAATHALPAFQHAPRLAVTSPEKRCGKSRLLDIIRALAYDALVTVNATTAAIFRRIGDGHPPTLLIDEADSMWGTKQASENNEDLRALVNAGHQRNRPALRCVGPQQTPTEFPTFAMVALAAIGSLPDTITDRAVNITMRRRAAGETVSAFRYRRDELPLAELRERLARWVAGVRVELENAEPDTPVEDRAADTWEPLLAIADAAGGRWPAEARIAAVTMVAAADESDIDTSLGVRILADCRGIFAEASQSTIASQQLVQRLREVEESPWEAFALDQRGLARRLRQYGVRSERIRPDGGAQVRGYRLEDFADAFARYLTPTPSPAVTASQSQVSPVTGTSAVTDTSVTAGASVTNGQAPELPIHPRRDAVTGGDVPTDVPVPRHLPVWTPQRQPVGACYLCGEPAPTVDELRRPCHVGCQA